MAGLILALQFFTRLPININVEFNDKNLARALCWLPMVGAVTGLMVGLVLKYTKGLGDLVSAALGLLAYFYVSGAIHLDGLADTVDGFMSNKDREKTLLAMSDSLMGSFGTVALIVYFFLKFSIYASLRENIVPYLVLISTLSKASALIAIKDFALAKDTGFAKHMHDSLNKYKGVYIELGVLYLALAIYRPLILVPIGLSQITSLVLYQISKKKIGGLTGDIYGTIVEVNEIVLGLAVVIWTSIF